MPADLELTDELYAELVDAKKRRDDHGWEGSNLVEVCRRMTPWQKLKASERMFWDARRAKADELQAGHTDWSEQEVQAEVKRIFLAEAMKEG